MTRAYRHWCGILRYPGRESFYFGTVQAETELEALRKLEAAWRVLSPHPMAPVEAMLPGTLAFHPEGGSS